MFPIPIIIAIVVAVIGGSTLLTIHLNKLLGKKFAILGSRTSGKTSLHTFLGSGEVLSKYVATTTDKTRENYFKLKHLKLRVSSSTDIGGTEDFVHLWENLIKNADYICYTIKTDEIHKQNEKYIDKVRGHINLILQHIDKHHMGKKKLYLIYNFCDLITDYEVNKEKFLDEFKIKTIKINQKNTISFFGSLIDKNRASDLCVQLLSKICEK